MARRDARTRTSPGLRTTATMMYGTVETDEERIEHMMRLREVQDETGGFTAFITWSYQPEHTELGGAEATGVDYLRTLALARIVLDNFDNLQASWVTQGGKVGQLSLAYGANDMGSVMIEENVVRAAGASYCMDEVEIVRNIEDAGFVPKRRNMHYDVLGDPIFREREVPRMLSLATARADGDASVPEELRNYPARSRETASASACLSEFLHRRMGAADCRRAHSSRFHHSPGRSYRRRARTHGCCRHRSWPRRHHARARQRAHAPRAVLSSRRDSADGPVPRLGPRDHGDASPVSGSRGSADRRRGARGDCRGESERHRPDRRHLQHAGDRAAAARGGRAGAGLLRAAAVQRLRSGGDDARGSREGGRGGVAATAWCASAWRRTRRTRSRRASFAAIRADLDAHPGQVSSVHLGESPEEMEFIRHGTGPWRTLLEELRVWTDAWEAPGTSPVEYLERLGFLDRRVLAVHGVQLAGDDLDRLRSLDMTVVACPRSNRYVGVGAPPLEAFYAMNVNVAFGTDSLASVEDLNLFSELAEARRIAPRVQARSLLESATRHGARALGFEDEFGTLEEGKRAQLIAVRLPDGVERCGRIPGWRDRAGRDHVARCEVNPRFGI